MTQAVEDFWFWHVRECHPALNSSAFGGKPEVLGAPSDAIDPQKKSISVAAIGLEVAIEKLVQAVSCIVRCLAVVLHPVIKQGHAGLEVRVIESVVRAGIDNELDWRPVVAPAGDFIGAVCRRRPIVEGPNEDERGYPRTRHGLLTWRIERSRRPEPQVAFRDELFERIGLRHGEGNPGACREADHGHAVWIAPARTTRAP
jgi:hypothetical protein